jgi:hypothetical protein
LIGASGKDRRGALVASGDVARSLTLDAVAEQSTDVSVRDYVEHGRALPQLFDLAPHKDPLAFESETGTAMGAPVYAAIRSRGDRQTDVRLLVDDGERHLPLAQTLASNLHCDVYLTPEGSFIRYVRESSALTGVSWDAIATDRASGEPTRWLVVRAPDLPPTVPTWFTTVRGRLRQSNGLVTVGLPNGMAFATKKTFRDTAFLAERMRPSPTRVTTLAVNADLGAFEISRFDDAGSLLGGVEFATLVTASLDVVQPDVQLALTWPTDAAACTALDVELVRFADAINRTVWVPQPQGAAFVLPGCGEFMAVDEVGAPSVWRAYPSRLAEGWRPRLGSDVDGRLVPLGEVVTASFLGVRCVSVPRSQIEQLRGWYESVRPCEGLFPVDLAVLADGRLGVLNDSGIPMAIGPRALRTLLREAGWAGEDLLLLTQPPAPYWNAVVDHAQSLADQLTADIWLPTLGADVWVQLDGSLAAQMPDGSAKAWQVVAYRASAGVDSRLADGIPVPAALATASGPARQARPPVPALPAVAGQTPGELPLVPRVAISSVAVADEATSLLEIVPAYAAALATTVAPTATLATATLPTVGAAHYAEAPQAQIEPAVEDDAVVTYASAFAIDWLPADPTVNHRTVQLYLWTPEPARPAEAWQLEAADLYLLASLDPLRVAERRRGGTLLRLSAPAGSAVDLIDEAEHVPAALHDRLREVAGTHLIPLSMLGQVRVTASFAIDPHGGVAARNAVGAGQLAIRFDHAEHGIPGLPNEVQHWPGKGQRADAPAYLVLPDGSVRHLAHQGYVALSRTRPEMEPGHHLLEVKIRKRRAIDVPATLRRMGGLPDGAHPHDFVGLDLILAEPDLGLAQVTRVWRPGTAGKTVVERLTGVNLDMVTADNPD